MEPGVETSVNCMKGAERGALQASFWKPLAGDRSSRVTRSLSPSSSLPPGLCRQLFLTHVPEEHANVVCQAFVLSLQNSPRQPPTSKSPLPIALAALPDTSENQEGNRLHGWVWLSLGTVDLS